MDPATGKPVTVTNVMTNFGWEYVWHCHLLGHEENDMMRPIVFQVSPAGAVEPGRRGRPAPPDGGDPHLDEQRHLPGRDGVPIQRATDAAFTQNVVDLHHRAPRTTTPIPPSPRHAYYYRVRAENAVSYSAWSNVVAVLVVCRPPADERDRQGGFATNARPGQGEPDLGRGSHHRRHGIQHPAGNKRRLHRGPEKR